MRLVIDLLDLAAARRLVDGALHGVRDAVGVHDDVAVRIAGRAADDLDERCVGAQEALFIGIEDGDQGDFRHVEALAQEVDADEHVEFAGTQVVDDLRALDRRDVGMEVAHLDADLREVVREVLRHLLGQRRDEHALVALDAQLDLGEQVVDLALERPHLDLGV